MCKRDGRSSASDESLAWKREIVVEVHHIMVSDYQEIFLETLRQIVRSLDSEIVYNKICSLIFFDLMFSALPELCCSLILF